MQNRGVLHSMGVGPFDPLDLRSESMIFKKRRVRTLTIFDALSDGGLHFFIGIRQMLTHHQLLVDFRDHFSKLIENTTKSPEKAKIINIHINLKPHANFH